MDQEGLRVFSTALGTVNDSDTIDPADWLPILYPEWAKVIPPRRLSDRPEVIRSSIFSAGRGSIAPVHLTLLCNLRRDSSILEIGCHHGRTALGLLDLLEPPGRYEGLDILAAPVEFARQAIEAEHPHFRSTGADIRSALYNPAGTLDAATFRFPYDDASFDVVYAASVFTHMLPPALGNYLAESRRVARVGARALFSVFLLDFYRGPGTTVAPLYEFEEAVAGVDGESWRIRPSFRSSSSRMRAESSSATSSMPAGACSA